MYNITKQHIGIFYEDREWRDKIYKDLRTKYKEVIERSRINANEALIQLHDGSIIRFVKAGEPSRGCRFDKIVIQENIDEDIITLFIDPCLRPKIKLEEMDSKGNFTGNYY